MCMKDEWKDKLSYRLHFYMDLNWRQQYVGIFEMEYEGIKFYFIDNEEHFGGSTPYAGMPWDMHHTVICMRILRNSHSSQKLY